MWCRGAGELKVREAALQAIGCVGIARPPLLLAPGAQAAMSAALSRAAPTPLKIRALHCLAELLKVTSPCMACSLYGHRGCMRVASALQHVVVPVYIKESASGPCIFPECRTAGLHVCLQSRPSLLISAAIRSSLFARSVRDTAFCTWLMAVH